MSNNTIEQALIQIERNLEKLESARNQVLDVTGSGKEITIIMVDLINKIQEVYDVINHESDSFIVGLADNQQNFDEKIKGMVDNWQNSVSDFLKQLKTLTAQVSDSVNKSVQETSSKTNILLHKQELAYSESILNLEKLEEAVDSFKMTLSEISFEELVKPIVSRIEDNEKNLSELISNSSKDASDLENKLQVQNQEYCERINVGLINRIKILEQNQKIYSYITWGLIAVVLLSIFIFK